MDARDPATDTAADPMPAPSPDQVAMGLRKYVRRVFGLILALALLIVVVRGIYVVWQVTQNPGQ